MNQYLFKRRSAMLQNDVAKKKAWVATKKKPDTDMRMIA